MQTIFAIWGAVRLAFQTLARSKLRAFLTIVGILIGIAAVVTMTALGEGARAQIASQLQSLGSNMVVIFPSMATGSKRVSEAAAVSLTEDDVSAIRRECPSVRRVAAANAAAATLVYEDQTHATRVHGTSKEYFEVRSWNIRKGALWTESDEQTGARVCVIGSSVREKLFGPVDPIGRSVRLNKMPCTIVGLLETKGQSGVGMDQDDAVLVPMKTLTGRIASKRGRSVEVILASASDEQTTKRAELQIKSLLMQRHRIGPDQEPDFRVFNLQDVQRSLEAVQGTLTALLLAVAAISLVVGGIGVMNIMLVSVTERAREIGIRMAIGARERDILIQFLVEAITLSLIGGLLGALTGYALIAFLRSSLDWPMQLSGRALLLALSVSGAIGVFFGFFPARRAARLDPIDALRRE